MIDGNSDSCNIAGMFPDKYAALYNSVPYDTCNREIKRIEAEVMMRLQNVMMIVITLLYMMS